MARASKGGFTLTPVAIKVSIEGFKSVVAHNVNIQHVVNDYSRCDVHVIARNNNEVVAFKEIFPNLKNVKPFTKMTVTITLKQGFANTLKSFDKVWEGTLIGITPEFSAGAVDFTIHGIGGLFYSGTVSLYSPGLHTDAATIGGFAPLSLSERILAEAQGFKDVVDLFKTTARRSKEFVGIGNQWLHNARGQMVGVKYDLIEADLAKIKKVPGLSFPVSLKIGGINANQFMQDYIRDVLNSPNITFWALYLATVVKLGTCLITIGDNVILAPSFYLDKPTNADKPYDALNPATNIIYAEDLLSTSPGIRPFDAPTRVGVFNSGQPFVDGTYMHELLYMGGPGGQGPQNNVSGFIAHPADGKSGAPTATQQEELTGARVLVLNPPHWLFNCVADTKVKRARDYEAGGSMTNPAKKQKDQAGEATKANFDITPEWNDSVRTYVKWLYNLNVLQSRAGAAACRLRMDCVPGIPCRIKAPWEAFDVDAYVVAVTHSISTTPEAASTMLQFTHSRFVSEEVDIVNPLYPDVKLSDALPVFEAAARSKATGASTGTGNPGAGGGAAGGVALNG